jgi:hypothetical protein
MCQHPQQQPSMLSHISLTTSVLTLKLPSDTLHLTCNSRFTLMPLTSLSPRPSQELAVISTWVTTTKTPINPYPMVHFCAIQQYSNMRSRLLLGPNLVHLLSMQKKKEGTVTRIALDEMGHNQDGTELKTDNTTADGIINNTVQQKRSKAMDVRFYWFKDIVEQSQFKVGWAPGDTNIGDYFTKHHSPAHHKCMRP